MFCEGEVDQEIEERGKCNEATGGRCYAARGHAAGTGPRRKKTDAGCVVVSTIGMGKIEGGQGKLTACWCRQLAIITNTTNRDTGQGGLGPRARFPFLLSPKFGAPSLPRLSVENSLSSPLALHITAAGGRVAAESYRKRSDHVQTRRNPVPVDKAEVELELIRPHITQKPMQRGEVGACSLELELELI